jgi:hypothetical protein
MGFPWCPKHSEGKVTKAVPRYSAFSLLHLYRKVTRRGKEFSSKEDQWNQIRQNIGIIFPSFMAWTPHTTFAALLLLSPPKKKKEWVDKLFFQFCISYFCSNTDLNE